MSDALRILFFGLVIRPILTIAIGAQIHHRERLPAKGPAIIVANHNSHLDTLTIMSMYPLRHLARLRPVAAVDYFLRTKWLAWFALHIIHIIPLERGGREKGIDPLAGCIEALDRGEILILFPEGSRGEPEILAQFKKGVAHLAHSRPATPVHPLFIRGLGKALPKGSFLLVPFNCDIAVGEPLYWRGDVNGFMADLQTEMHALAETLHETPWE